MRASNRDLWDVLPRAHAHRASARFMQHVGRIGATVRHAAQNRKLSISATVAPPDSAGISGSAVRQLRMVRRVIRGMPRCRARAPRSRAIAHGSSCPGPALIRHDRRRVCRAPPLPFDALPLRQPHSTTPLPDPQAGFHVRLAGVGQCSPARTERALRAQPSAVPADNCRSTSR